MSRSRIAIALMVVMFVGSVGAVAQAGPPPGAFCNANGDFGFSHATCVTLVNDGNNRPTGICKLLEDLDISPFKNHGQCVKAFG